MVRPESSAHHSSPGVLVIPKIHLTAMAAVYPWRPLDAASLRVAPLTGAKAGSLGPQA
jgi:hypothetical protein